MLSPFNRIRAALTQDVAPSPRSRVVAGSAAPVTDGSPAGRLRSALTTVSERATGDERGLRVAIRDYTLAERTRGVLVERVIIALKRQVRDVVLVRRGDPFCDDLVARVVGWCIDDYFHLPPVSTVPRITPSPGGSAPP
jgi:hypothetical protein